MRRPLSAFPCLLFAIYCLLFASSCAQLDIARRSDLTLLKQESRAIETRAEERTKDEIRKLETINQNLLNISKSHSELRAELSLIREYLEVVGGKVDDSRTKFSDFVLKKESIQMLKNQIEGLQEKLYSVFSSSEIALNNSPDSLYDLASSDYLRGNTDLALRGFSLFISQYPAHPALPGAYYYRGQIYFNTKQYDLAGQDFRVIISTFSGSEYVVRALFKTAQIAEEKNDTNLASGLYGDIMKNYPLSDEAKLARDRMLAIMRKK